MLINASWEKIIVQNCQQYKIWGSSTFAHKTAFKKTLFEWHV